MCLQESKLWSFDCESWKKNGNVVVENVDACIPHLNCLFRMKRLFNCVLYWKREICENDDMSVGLMREEFMIAYLIDCLEPENCTIFACTCGA